MRIATFNVNGIVSRLPQLLAWLERESPDVVCLQELKAEDRRFPKAAIRAAGYGAIHHGQRSWNGVAILARGTAPEEIRRGLPGDPADDQSRYLEAMVGGIHIACLYLPNGNPQPGPKFDYKLAWFARLIRHAKKLHESGTPVVLAGDFNVVPTDLDIYDPTSWKKDALLQPESRAAYGRLLRQGWIDSLRALHPGEAIFTFWDYFRNHWDRNAGLRIDHLLLNATLAPRLIDANVDRWVRGAPHASDHAPVWIELGKKNAKRATKARTIGTLGKKSALPAKLKPVLATLVDRPPGNAKDWIFEIKFDGYRLLARVDAKVVRLFTRNGHDWTSKLPHLSRAIRALKLKPGWFDGEIVMPDDSRKSGASFQSLQNAFDSERTSSIVYYLFDLPYYAGRDLTQVPLHERRALLKSLLHQARDPVRFSEAFDAEPKDLVASACQLGLEGIIGKRAASTYNSRRSPDWIKLKCSNRQEFVIGGWTDPKGGRAGLGALLVGVHDKQGKLKYAGKVGTGFDDKMLLGLRRKLEAIATPRSPFTSRTADARSAHWVKPTLLAEVVFSEWTQDGHLRHPVFQSLRTDKPATGIIREQPVAPLGPDVEESHAGLPARLRVTHPDRVIDPSSDITKIDLIRYYARAGTLMMEHLAKRPVSLVRAPRGITGQLFFQKHLESGEMEGVEKLDPALDRDHVALLAIAKPLGLLSAAQMNVVEFHTWNATSNAIDKPDRMTFDLDPGEGVRWNAMQEGAELMQSFLRQLGLTGFLKTSGGKGLHVVTPIRRQHDWDTVKDFSKAIVQHMAQVLPNQFVAKSGPQNRVGRIFIDYLRNGFGATTACAWSARARPGMGVSVPIAWQELRTIKSGAHWSVRNVDDRLLIGNKPWSGYAKHSVSIGPVMKKLRFKPT
ncbi:MAG: DNA ligase D [Steroidobacteraceae bacterium]